MVSGSTSGDQLLVVKILVLILIIDEKSVSDMGTSTLLRD